MFLRLVFGILFLLFLTSSSEIGDEDNVVISENSTATSSETKKPKAGLSKDQIVLERWRTFERVLKHYTSQGVKLVLSSLLDFSARITISSKCAGSLMKVVHGIKGMKTWAFQMLDASGKLPNGILNGYLSSLGDFDGCLSLEVPGPHPFRGKYCTLFITPPLADRKPFRKADETPSIFVNFTKKGTLMEELQRRSGYLHQVSLRTSICVPSTCSRQDIQTIADNLREMTKIHLNTTVPTCDIIEPVVFSKSDIAIICVMSIILLLAVTATATDVALNVINKEKRLKVEESSTSVKCLMCFSAYTNTLRLLKKDAANSIKFFHGMKVVTILWVIMNHSYVYVNLNLSGSLTTMKAFGSEIAHLVTANGFLVVDTFFFISSVLLAYACAGRHIDVPKNIFRRLWRLTPPFMLFIAAAMLTPHMGSGPGWKETLVDRIDACKRKWWANLLYINNFMDSHDTCFHWLWYIPADTHLYILALFILLPSKNRPRLAVGINGAMFIAGTVATAAAHVHYELLPTTLYAFSNFDDLRYFTDNSYFRSYTHITTTCIGLYVGSFLAKKPKLKIPTFLNILGWLSSMTFGLLVVYGAYDWRDGNFPGMAVSTIYACTAKVVWALALSYITVACFTGNGGVITSILSWSVFVPLSRLTYMAYIVHPIFQFMYIGSSRIPIATDHRTIVYRYLGNVVAAFSFAYLASLLFEIPFMGLDRIMFPGKVVPKASLKSKPELNGKFGKQPKKDKCAVATINIRKIENEGH